MATETATPAQPTMRVKNPELQAMAKVDDILADLSEESRKRVVAWVLSTYTPSPKE